MTAKAKAAAPGRRDFLRALAAGTGAAAVSTMTFATDAKADGESDAEKRKPRYRESEHVRIYYRVNQYPN